MHKLNSGATLMALAICIILFTVAASDKNRENGQLQSKDAIVKMSS